MPLKIKLLKTIYRSGGFTPFHRLNRRKLLVLTYHRFSSHKELNKVSAAEFSAHLEYLKKYTSVISLSEAVEHLAKQTRLPPNSTVITVDDGYRDTFDVAYPLLNSFGFPATLFAVTDFIDGKCWLWTDRIRFIFSNTKKTSLVIELDAGARFDVKWRSTKEASELGERINSILKQLPNAQKEAKIGVISDQLEVEVPRLPPVEYGPINWQQAREMEDHNFAVESHTATHPILTSLEPSGLNGELRRSKERIEKELSKTVNHFCYPNGNFNESVKRSVEDVGYRSAVSTDYGFNNGNEDPFALKRIGGHFAMENFAQSVSGFESAKLRFARMKYSA